jgi:hypothetical protein
VANEANNPHVLKKEARREAEQAMTARCALRCEQMNKNGKPGNQAKAQSAPTEHSRPSENSARKKWELDGFAKNMAELFNEARATRGDRGAGGGFRKGAE